MTKSEIRRAAQWMRPVWVGMLEAWALAARLCALTGVARKLEAWAKGQ